MTKETETKMVNTFVRYFELQHKPSRGLYDGEHLERCLSQKMLSYLFGKSCQNVTKKESVRNNLIPLGGLHSDWSGSCWKLLSLFCSVRTLSAPVEKFSTVQAEYARLEKLLVQLAALGRGWLPMLYKFTFIYVQQTVQFFSQMFKLSFPTKWSLCWGEITIITARSPFS